MPGRWMAAGIVVFWLAMMGWLTVRELVPYFDLAAEPNLAETLAASARDGPVDWRVSQNGEDIGTATTQVLIHTVNYELFQEVRLNRFIADTKLTVTSRAMVNLFGDVQRIIMRAEVPEWKFDLALDGQPKGNELHVKVSLRLLGEEFRNDYRFQYAARDIFLSSLCPADRMPGLWPGKAWEARIVNPLDLKANPLDRHAGAAPGRLLEQETILVQVEKEPEVLLWEGKQVPCYVVVTRHPDMTVRIWVQRDGDNLVLKQTAAWGSYRFEIVRLPRRPDAE
jgi:hypothetical protein